MRVFNIILIFLSILALSCSGSGSDTVTSDALSGEDLYKKPHSDGNTFSCATCHALTESDSLRPPGHPVGDAWSRGSYKNGQIGTLLEAVNSCRQEWMAATAYTEDKAEWVALDAFLKEQDEKKVSEPLSFTIVSPSDDLTGGSVEAGKALFAKTCGICHGEKAKGTSVGPGLAGTKLSAAKIAERIRLSGSSDSVVYSGLTGGKMPFWSRERLSDSEVNDLIAWLSMTESEEITEKTEGETDLSVSGARSGCGTDHNMVGTTTTLSTLYHKVAGKATVVDNCTIKIEGFYFDGGGIDVRFYSGSNGNFKAGSALTVNFLGQAFENGTAIFRLPQGVTLDQFDSISVWCVAVGISFGHGTFQ